MKLNRYPWKKLFLFTLLTLFLLPAHAALTDGLILHYDFESISGSSVYDLSHHSNTGTLMGSPLTTVGQTGSGVYFPTVTDYLQMPSGLLNAQTSFSVAAWVKLNSLNSWSRIFDFGSGTLYNIFLTPNSGAGTLRFAMKNGGAEELIDAPGPMNVGEWVHVAVTFSWGVWTSKGIGRLYVNGLEVGSNTSFTINPSKLPQTTQNYIGKSQYPDPTLDGTLDDFRVYDRELTGAEILELNNYSATLVDAYNSIVLTGDLSKVTSSLTLQKTAGQAALPIAWTSSSPDVVAADGTVNRPKYFDQTVTLKATVSSTENGKTVSMTKEFALTVLALENIHWESLILENDVWKYLAATSEPASTWYQSGFNDAAWNSAKGGIGFGDNDDTTIIAKCNSLYLRRQISIPDVTKIDKLVMDIDYDDAFVLYVNGVECARSSNVTGAFPTYNKALGTDHEAKMYSGGSPERFQLNAASLVTGTNTFAIQVLNQSLSSTDLSSRIFIHARFKSGETTFHPTPTWFTEPVTYESSNLPLVFINTNGQSINATGKILADMKTLNKVGDLNYVTDTTYEYNGKVGIKIRGFTSAGFPKKSYTVETCVSLDSSKNVKLLGLPKENDWVFHGPYPDKSLMRNALAYHLGNLTGHWSPRTRFFELYMNGTYQGVYTLVEKIKIDKNRLGLASVNPTDTMGDELTGGYILKLDRPESTDVEGVNYWISPYKAWTTLQQKEYFLFQDPDGEDLHPKQFNYIKQTITDFENAMYSSQYTDKVTGYLPKVDFKSFVDYYILTELSRNLDGYRISTFIHKDKDSKGGKITMGPYWDYDICFGNANFFSAGNTAGWVIDGMGNADGYAMPFWWQKFRLDPYFNGWLKVYWNDWKAKYINTTYLNQFIDSCANEMIDAQKRNFETWNILSTAVWPNNAVPGSYAGELSYLKNWLSNRITWMDGQIQAITDVVDDVQTGVVPMDLVAYPNPFTDRFAFKFHLSEEALVEIEVRDLTGRLVLHRLERTEGGLREWPVDATELAVNSPVYIYRVKVDGVVRRTGKLIRQ